MDEIQHSDSSKIVDGADWRYDSSICKLIKGIAVVNAENGQLREVNAQELTRLFFECDTFRFDDWSDPTWKTVIVMYGIDDLW